MVSVCFAKSDLIYVWTVSTSVSQPVVRGPLGVKLSRSFWTKQSLACFVAISESINSEKYAYMSLNSEVV